MLHQLRYLLLLLIIVGVLGCREGGEKINDSFTLFNFSGQTMGTTYSVKYVYTEEILNPDSIDSLLKNYNQAVSTYIKESVISKVNNAQDSLVLPLDEKSRIFKENFILTKTVFDVSGNYYDPTVMPLVNYFGFGYQGKEAPIIIDTAAVDSIRQFVGMDKISIYSNDSTMVIKKQFPQTQIDFSSVAKGHGVDEVGRYLEKMGISNYLVEIGGECRARGRKADGKIWTLGISVPDEGSDPTEFIHYVSLDNLSIATSGNYRNFRENKSGKFGHTINPISGLPELNSIVSATILSPDCADADAWATAVMAMGPEKTNKLMKDFEFEMMYIYIDEMGEFNAVYSEGFEKFLVKNN